MIYIKSTREIELMKVAGQAVSSAFKAIKEAIRPGMSTLDIDQIVEKTFTEHGCTSAEKGYYGYPANACVSINEELVHGIPSNRKILKEGDIVSVDLVASYQGYMADACRTFAVGKLSPKAENLLKVTKDAFFVGLKEVKVGNYIGDISHAIQTYVEAHDYNVTRDYTGHGIGAHMHEDPSIPNYGKEGTGARIEPGMTLCIEPMVLEGKKDIRVLPDGWTAVSKDKKLTAHYENTVVVYSDKVEIITMYEGEE